MCIIGVLCEVWIIVTKVSWVFVLFQSNIQESTKFISLQSKLKVPTLGHWFQYFCSNNCFIRLAVNYLVSMNQRDCLSSNQLTAPNTLLLANDKLSPVPCRLCFIPDITWETSPIGGCLGGDLCKHIYVQF